LSVALGIAQKEAVIESDAVGQGSLEVKFSDWDCMLIPGDELALDWEQLLLAFADYLDHKSGELVEKRQGEHTWHVPREVGPFLDALIALGEEGPRARARAQCPIGFLNLCIVEAVSLSTMHTSGLDASVSCIEGLMREVPLMALAGSKWPTFRMLQMLWQMNKFPYREYGYKNINRFVQRFFSDLALTPEELTPFGAGITVPWYSWVGFDENGGTELDQRLHDKMTKSPLRLHGGFAPLVMALAAVVRESVLRDGRGREEGSRPMIRVSLVHGELWADLMLVSAARWAAVGLRASLYMAMDEAALEKCREFHLICYSTGVPNILHKYTITTLATHLGVDVLYVDLDAVPMGPDTLERIVSTVEVADPFHLAVSTHNYDCLNAGVWFARGSSSTARFFIVFLEYLQEHWYEGDQRAFNALATGNVSVSFMEEPRSKLPPRLRVAVLSPDEFAGSSGFANREEVRIFHAYKVYGDEKAALVDAMYGVDGLSEETRHSRELMWKWALSPDAQAAIREGALAAISKYEKPRPASRCW